jgi:uncharacterized protein YbjT (DUF2867 family)
MPALTILILGASGSAGGSVLQACLESSTVGEVRTIARRPLGLPPSRFARRRPGAHSKLREFQHGDYQNFAAVEAAFAGIDACFYCLGKSVRQVSGEAEYRTITHDFALAAAAALRAQSPAAVFHFISGQGANLRSRFMWARVKAETERDLLARFDAVCWRPASIDGVPSASEPAMYKALRPVARVLLRPFRSLYVTGEGIGLAMLQTTIDGVRGRIFENAAIRDIAGRASPSSSS